MISSETVQWLHGTLPGWRARRQVRRAICRIPGSSVAPLVQDHTYLSRSRLKALESHIRIIDREKIPGAFVECGVGAGGSAALLGLWMNRLAARRVYLFDTFEGLPAPTANDPDYEEAEKWTGRCRGTVDEITTLLQSLKVDLDRVTFIRGLFQRTLPTWQGEPIALLHIDGDWYDSVHISLTALWDRVAPGGYIQIDDYGTWQGCKKAVDEFLGQRGLLHELRPIDGAGVWIRKSLQVP